MDNDISYSSIEEMHTALVRREISPRALYDYLRDNKDKIRGSETAYHNLSVEFERQNCPSFAADVAAIGVTVYPMSTDLLPAMISYAQSSGNIEYCEKGLAKLKEIPRKYWTWRTFTFVVDYYKDNLASLDNPKKYEESLAAAKENISEFKQYIPHEERAYVAEAEMYLHQNEYQNAINALIDGVSHVSVAPQCCMKLADLYLQIGEYKKVEEYARKGILASTQDQPTVSIGYLYYLFALSLDAQRMFSKINCQAFDRSMIMEIVTAYHTADQLFINEGRSTVSYRNTIKAKLIILAMEEGISVETQSDSV